MSPTMERIPFGARHLHDEVGVMRYGHELGEHRSPEDGMVGGAEVRDLEC
jgi:hypothetical protein